MTLDLYINRSDNRTLNKSLVNVVDGLPCDFKYPTNEDNPDILLASSFGDSITEANYCRVRETGLYYSIESRSYERGAMINLHCVVDPFFTYRNYIGSIPALIERQEFQYDPYLVDNMAILSQGVFYDNVVVGSIISNGNHVVVNTTGGLTKTT